MDEVQPGQIRAYDSSLEALLSEVFAPKLDGQTRTGGFLSQPERSPQARRRRNEMAVRRCNSEDAHVRRQPLQSPIIASGKRGRITRENVEPPSALDDVLGHLLPAEAPDGDVRREMKADEQQTG